MTTTRRNAEVTKPSGPTAPLEPPRGLSGVIAARTRLSRVDGERGELILCGYPLEQVAHRLVFEEMVHLLLHDRLPNVTERETLRQAMARGRSLHRDAIELLRDGVGGNATPMGLLRLGLARVALGQRRPLALLGSLVSLVAAVQRLREGLVPVEPDPALGHAESLLYQLRGERPAPRETRALDTYFNTVVDHGLNASTFTARVIASTGSDLASALQGALGALEGPLHGGAPGPALEALLALRRRGGDLRASTTEWVERELARGARILGFGHRVYRVRDPRADVLGRAARELLGEAPLLSDAQTHEDAVLEALARLKPGRRIQTNVEFYTALLLHGLGLQSSLFTCAFACSRAAGWTAHVAEQAQTGTLIRPRAEYVGAHRALPSPAPGAGAPETHDASSDLST